MGSGPFQDWAVEHRAFLTSHNRGGQNSGPQLYAREGVFVDISSGDFRSLFCIDLATC